MGIMFSFVCRFTVYSNHLYTGHPNTGFCSIRFPNGLSPQASKMMVDHLKTGHFHPVFKWFGSTDHSKTGPFLNRTHLDHSKSGLVRYSDGYCICLSKRTLYFSNPYCSSFSVFEWLKKLNVIVTRPLCLVESLTLDAAARRERSLFTSHTFCPNNSSCIYHYVWSSHTC